jgi:hypothetical protein
MQGDHAECTPGIAIAKWDRVGADAKWNIKEPVMQQGEISGSRMEKY